MIDFVADRCPGSGRRTPRADAESDAPRLSLNGGWDFRLSPTAAGTGDQLLDPASDGWATIRVPAHWVLEGYDQPLYTNTAYPFPIDPPRVPTRTRPATTGCVFDAADRTGRPARVLRFQGVDSCAKVWLNGAELGWSRAAGCRSSSTSPSLRPGGNVLAVRVHRWSAARYLEDQDMWWLPGIFRDVELIAPAGGAIDDSLRARRLRPRHRRRHAARRRRRAGAIVDVPELGDRIATGETGRRAGRAVERRDAAALPRHADRRRASGSPLPVGFRRVEIVDGVFTVNGRPVPASAA